MKVNSRIYKGIEFVQLNDLPNDQREKILESLDEELIIKILIDKEIVRNCVQYKDYENWYETVYSPTIKKIEIKEQPVASPSIRIALDKI